VIFAVEERSLKHLRNCEQNCRVHVRLSRLPAFRLPHCWTRRGSGLGNNDICRSAQVGVLIGRGANTLPEIVLNVFFGFLLLAGEWLERFGQWVVL